MDEPNIINIIISSKHFTVETDHKPLARVRIQKAANSCTAETTTNDAEFDDLIVQYKPGKSLYIADTLSRAPSAAVGESQDQYMVHTIENLPISNEKIQEFQRATNDLTLQTLQHTIQDGLITNQVLTKVSENTGQFVTKLTPKTVYCFVGKDLSNHRQ